MELLKDVSSLFFGEIKLLLDFVDLVVDIVVKFLIKFIFYVLRQVVIEVLVRVLRHIHRPWHLLLGHHGVVDWELTILALRGPHILHSRCSEGKHVLIETLHIHHVREALRHSLEVSLHVWHIGYLYSVAIVVV